MAGSVNGRFVGRFRNLGLAEREARDQRTVRSFGPTRPIAHRGHAGPGRPEASRCSTVARTPKRAYSVGWHPANQRELPRATEKVCRARAPRLKGEIVKMHLGVLTRFTKARGQRTRRGVGLLQPFAHRGHAGPARPERSRCSTARHALRGKSSKCAGTF